MGEVLDLAERAWRGELEGTQVHPGTALVGLEELAPGLAFMSAFSNAAVIATGDGLVMVDTSSAFHASQFFAGVRGWSPERVHTAVYTHGHVDHVFGLAPFEEEARTRGWSATTVVAHRACPARFDRYKLTNGYNGIINQRQFGFQRPYFPSDFRYPDRTVEAGESLSIGGVAIELHHDRGETDDHLWAWLPEQRALYTGDLFIWAAPNCGNPQKVQRYPREWAAGLRRMRDLEAELLMPGHGPPIVGAARVRQALSETVELLETILEQALRLMNEGATLDEVLHGVAVPDPPPDKKGPTTFRGEHTTSGSIDAGSHASPRPGTWHGSPWQKARGRTPQPPEHPATGQPSHDHHLPNRRTTRHKSPASRSTGSSPVA